MRKALTTYSAVVILLLGLAIGFDFWSKDIQPIKRYASEIDSYLREQEALAAKMLAKKQAFFQTQLAGPPVEDKAGSAENHARELAEVANEDFTLCFLRGDSVVFWSNNNAFPSKKDLSNWKNAPDFQPAIFQIPSGQYEVLRQPFENYQLFTLIPVKYAFASSDYVTRQNFPACPNVPRDVEFSFEKTDFPIHASDGRAIGFLTATKANVQFLQFLQVKFWLYLAALISFFMLVNLVSRWLAEKYQPYVGAAVLIPVVGGIVFLNQKLDLTRRFESLDLFARTFKTPFLSNSIGDMLINIGILLWLMVFFHRHFQVKSYRAAPFPLRFAVGVLCYLSIVMSILVSAWIFRELVWNSNISFDFTNIFTLSLYSIMAIIGVIFLLGAMFLFSHRMVISVYSGDLNIKQRTAAACLAVVCASPIMLAFRDQLEVDPWQVVSFSLFYAIAFDFFMDQKKFQLPWIVGWLVVFSWFATILLFKYNNSKDLFWRKLYAEKLATERDSTAEVQLDAFRNDLRADRRLPNMIAPPPFSTGRDSLQRYVNRYFYSKNYLFQHYKFEIAAFDKNDVVALDSQTVAWPAMQAQWERARPVMGDEMRLWKDSSGHFRYLMRLEVPAQGDVAHAVRLYFLIDLSQRTPTNVFTQLFYSKPYKDLSFLSRYDYAIFKNKELVIQKGKLSESAIQQAMNPQKLDAPKHPNSPNEEGRNDLIYNSGAEDKGNTVVVIGRKTGGVVKMFYLFSYIFTTLSVFMLLLAGINSVVRILPEYYQFVISGKGMLSKRIQTYMGGVIIVSFFVIGWLTLDNFNKAAQDNIRENLNTRTSSMLSQIESSVEAWIKGGEKRSELLKKNVDPLAKTYASDVNLYDEQGNLIYTSQPELAIIGAISPKMSSTAFYALKKMGRSESIEQERTGSFEYSTDYLPLRDRKLHTYAYIGVPYYLKGSAIRTDISDFIGKLLTLYVCLLLSAGFIAFGVADSIVKPIKKLGQQLQDVRLEEKNEPLPYEGKDELSDLIAEYNRMLEKLEESKLLLTKSEREGAWREMARQVAHEIKNPLTTMKLSMQQLERAYRSDPTDAENYLKRATQRLVEQIDSLAHIANEFSMFAKIDQPSKNDLVINDVVRSVFDLFSEHENTDFVIHEPSERFHILGDNSHLMRVFNNLIINALQAIPSSQRGRIEVSIFERKGMAVVQVSDNGGGVPNEIRHKIFEPNFTTKTSGSGLGLAISKRIIDSLDGNMFFHVREEKGTDFFVELPIVQVETEATT